MAAESGFAAVTCGACGLAQVVARRTDKKGRRMCKVCGAAGDASALFPVFGEADKAKELRSLVQRKNEESANSTSAFTSARALSKNVYPGLSRLV